MSSGVKMKSNLWTLQFFLSNEGVCEVRADFHNHNIMECTCSTWSSWRKCKHIKFVKKSITENNGYFPIKLESDAEDFLDEEGGPEEFRKMLLKYSVVKVLP